MINELNQEKLKKILKYDPITGIFTYACDRGKCYKGNRAGTERPDGYRQICIGGKTYLEHRLAWLYMKGYWPPDQIDHKDGKRANRAFANLREATHSQNKMNSLRQVNNITGYKGVHFSQGHNSYGAQIKKNGEITFLGYFTNPQQAHEAYVKAAIKLHGVFANIGETS